MSHRSIQSTKCLIAYSLLVLALANVVRAQRVPDSAAEARLRYSGGQQAVDRYRAQLATEQASAPNWAEALQHPELNVRHQAMQELQVKAYKGEPLTDAIDVLRKYASLQLQFGSRDETLMMQQRAFEILGVVDQDFAASRMARYLASNLHVGQYAPREQNIAMGVLEKINHVSVNLDDDLLRALERARAGDRRQQVNNKGPEGILLYVTAKLAQDKKRAGQAVLDAMRWPLADDGCYERYHFLAVRFAAEHCGSLLPRLIQAYRTNNRPEYLHMIAALAVHHDDAWTFFENYVQDRFVDQYNKRSMATAFADSWLLASKETQRANAEKAKQLNTKAPGWLEWRSTDTQRLLYYSKKKADVMEMFREAIDYRSPEPNRPFQNAGR